MRRCLVRIDGLYKKVLKQLTGFLSSLESVQSVGSLSSVAGCQEFIKGRPVLTKSNLTQWLMTIKRVNSLTLRRFGLIT